MPVPAARVGRFGLEGDRHRHDTVHGGPFRAVSLFAIEAIRRVEADGHPIFPGSTGENLTTEGIELALLPTGTRIAVGDEVVLEITRPAMPCDVIADSFRDRRAGRISALRFPTDSRMYALVVREGVVRPGDAIRVLPAVDQAPAVLHARLDLLEDVERHAWLTLWRALAATGTPISVLDDGELAVATCPAVPGDLFNRALGLRQLPNLLDRMLARYLRAGTSGWLVAPDAPWPGAVADGSSPIYAASVADVLARTSEARASAPDRLSIRPVGPPEADRWAAVFVEAFGLDGAPAFAWRTLAPHLAAATGERLLLAEVEGEPAAVAALFARRKVSVVTAGGVRPAFRGIGIQRALIAERARIAAEAGCETVMATADPGSPSSANLERMGFERVWDRTLWRFDPTLDGEAALAATAGAA